MSSASSDAAVLAALIAVLLAGAGLVLFVLSRSGGGQEKSQVRRKRRVFALSPAIDRGLFSTSSFVFISAFFFPFLTLFVLCPFPSRYPIQDNSDAAVPAAEVAAGGGGQRQQQQQGQQQLNRRDRLGAGLARRRAAAAAAAAAATDDNNEDASDYDSSDDGDNRAPLRARDARRAAAAAQRAALEARTEKKQSYEERRRIREEARERAEEARDAEMLREAEERQRLEDEEAAKWASLIEKEEEGEEGNADDGDGDGGAENQLERFIDFIERRKIVTLEELGAAFGLRASEAIDRIRVLEKEGRLSGIMDERGAFIHVSREEFEKVAEFIRSKGRVAISALAAESGRLIDLEPKKESREVEAGELDEGAEGGGVSSLDALAGDDE